MEFDATFIIATISFIVFVLIMNRIFYAPILKIMQERQNLVEENYSSAKATKLETQKEIDYLDFFYDDGNNGKINLNSGNIWQN